MKRWQPSISRVTHFHPDWNIPYRLEIKMWSDNFWALPKPELIPGQLSNESAVRIHYSNAGDTQAMRVQC